MCAYRFAHIYRTRKCTSPERASPQRFSRDSARWSRVARPFSHSREGLVYVHTRANQLLPLLPRYYLSHASGADFYKRSDSRGKFIKSLPPSATFVHGTLSRRLERTEEKERESPLLFPSIFLDCTWTINGVSEGRSRDFEPLFSAPSANCISWNQARELASPLRLQEGHTLGALHSIHARTERYNCMFEFNSKDPTALNYSGTLVPCSIKRREKKRRERKILEV